MSTIYIHSFIYLFAVTFDQFNVFIWIHVFFFQKSKKVFYGPKIWDHIENIYIKCEINELYIIWKLNK